MIQNLIKHRNVPLKGDPMTAKTYLFGGAAALALILAGCDVVRAPANDTQADSDTASTQSADAETSAFDEAALAENPLLQDWDTPYGAPPFAEIADEDYLPAIDFAIAELQGEIEAIANNEEAPTFENTIVALDKAGGMLSQVALVF